jgi:hypothetical protein
MDKENTSKKRHTIGSNIINSVLNSEVVSKSLFKTSNKRKFYEIDNPYNFNEDFLTNNRTKNDSFI